MWLRKKYICIVKYKNATKSFYLGNETKLKSQLQQFYLDDLHTKKIDYVKDEVKMIVSNVISDFAMPVDIDLNGVEKRLEVSEKLSSINISEHSVIHIRDWESLIITKINPDLKKLN